MKLQIGVIDRIENKNVPRNDTAKSLQLTEKQKNLRGNKNASVNVPNLATMLGVRKDNKA